MHAFRSFHINYNYWQGLSHVLQIRLCVLSRLALNKQLNRLHPATIYRPAAFSYICLSPTRASQAL